MIPELQNNVSMCLTRKYTSTQVYKHTIQHKYTIRNKYSLVQIVAKSYALHVKLHLASKPIFFKKTMMQDFQNNVYKCLTRKYTNTQVHKYTIKHKYTIRHKYSLVQFVAKSYALHVRLHLASKPNF